MGKSYKERKSKYEDINDKEELIKLLEEKDEQILKREIEIAYLKELKKIRLEEKRVKKNKSGADPLIP